MRTTTQPRRRPVIAFLGALALGAAWIPVTAAPAAANMATPVPVCAGAHELLVDVTQDVRSETFLPARDGHMWASFSYTQHLHIWSVGAHQYCLRKDFEGTWVSIAGLSPGLTGTISDGLTGTFTDTTYWEWTGTLTPLAPTTGDLGDVDAGCTATGVCADTSFLIVDTYYFPQGSHHCNSVRRDLEIDGGTHGHISLTIDGDPNRINASGDITG